MYINHLKYLDIGKENILCDKDNLRYELLFKLDAIVL